MLLKAYRLTAEEDMLRSKIFSMHQTPRPRQGQEPALVRAYETPELAAFCSPEWLANDKRKTVVVREILILRRNHRQLHLRGNSVFPRPRTVSDIRKIEC